MKATITIDKSFDESKEFSKEWTLGDFKDFMRDEGEYLDKLANLADTRTERGKLFTVTYTVTLER